MLDATPAGVRREEEGRGWEAETLLGVLVAWGPSSRKSAADRRGRDRRVEADGGSEDRSSAGGRVEAVFELGVAWGSGEDEGPWSDEGEDSASSDWSTIASSLTSTSISFGSDDGGEASPELPFTTGTWVEGYD